MTYSLRLFFTCLVSTAVLAGGAAQAATAPSDAGWYVGASAGRTDLTYPDGGGDLEADGYAVHGGYRFNRHFAVEAGYADLGDARFQYDCPSGLVCVPENYPITFSQDFSRADIALVGILPVNARFDLFAKVGYAQARYEESVRFGTSGTARESDDSSETIYGVGARLNFDSPWSLRLQWDRSEVSDVDVDGYWLGVEYRFGR
jgi:OOP family OmpA-OmpF porin